MYIYDSTIQYKCYLFFFHYDTIVHPRMKIECSLPYVLYIQCMILSYFLDWGTAHTLLGDVTNPFCRHSHTIWILCSVPLKIHRPFWAFVRVYFNATRCINSIYSALSGRTGTHRRAHLHTNQVHCDDGVHTNVCRKRTHTQRNISSSYMCDVHNFYSRFMPTSTISNLIIIFSRLFRKNRENMWESHVDKVED